MRITPGTQRPTLRNLHKLAYIIILPYGTEPLTGGIDDSTNLHTSCPGTCEKPYSEQKRTPCWNASLSYVLPNGVWTLKGYVKNIMNYAVKTATWIWVHRELDEGNPRTYGAVCR